MTVVKILSATTVSVFVLTGMGAMADDYRQPRLLKRSSSQPSPSPQRSADPAQPPSTQPPADPTQFASITTATAALVSSTGKDVGNVALTQRRSGVRLVL